MVELTLSCACDVSVCVCCVCAWARGVLVCMVSERIRIAWERVLYKFRLAEFLVVYE